MKRFTVYPKHKGQSVFSSTELKLTQKDIDDLDVVIENMFTECEQNYPEESEHPEDLAEIVREHVQECITVLDDMGDQEYSSALKHAVMNSPDVFVRIDNYVFDHC